MCDKGHLGNTLSPVKEVSFCNCSLHGERLVCKRLVHSVECRSKELRNVSIPLIEGGKYVVPVKRCPKNSS